MSETFSQIEQPFQTVEDRDGTQAPDDRASITSDERTKAESFWGDHPVNIRVSIPFFFGRWYFTLVGGPERRSRKRLELERKKNPLFKLGNVIFLFVLGSIIGTATAVLIINGAMQFFDSSYTVMTP